MPLASLLLPLLIQVGPDPSAGAMVDHSAMVQDRPPLERSEVSAVPVAKPWLKDCFDLIDSDPARAHSQAQIRLAASTGIDRVLANHCLGMASSALGRWSDAYGAFIAARDGAPADETRYRARLELLAGNAALVDGRADEALALFTSGFTGAETAGDGTLAALAAIDEARALVALEREAEALARLEFVHARQPDLAEAWLLSATLFRRMDRLEDAQAHIERAGTLVPASDDMRLAIGLEAGLISALAGREDAARRSWQSVIDVAPDSAQAADARGYLSQLSGPATPQ